MTMPHLMNCPHSGDGWCLACVAALADDRDSRMKEHERLRSIIGMTIPGQHPDEINPRASTFMDERRNFERELECNRAYARFLRMTIDEMVVRLKSMKDHIEHSQQVHTNDFGMCTAVNGDELVCTINTMLIPPQFDMQRQLEREAQMQQIEHDIEQDHGQEMAGSL
jgi:hypothetical protein